MKKAISILFFSILNIGVSVASTSTIDPTDLRLIYNDQFKYCVPESFVQKCLDGNEFGRKELYPEETKENLKTDIRRIHSSIIEKNPIKEKLAVFTAGGPGVGKTTLMRRYLSEAAAEGKIFAYVDPDDVCLRNMNETWGKKPKDTFLEKKAAYDEMRPGSNGAAHVILANLIREQYAFYFGMTASSPMTANTFKWLKEQGYRIHLIHVTAPGSVCWQSIQERDKTFVQTTEEDTIQKGKLVPQRIHDTYLKYADQIDFYYRDAFSEEARLAAKWIRTDGEQAKGVLTVTDQTAYESLKKTHNEVCKELGREDILWERSVEAH